jgi:putative transposase
MAPRLPRVLIPHCAHHIVQRGHSRKDVFIGPNDCDAYLDDLCSKKAELDVQVHAYCLMSNHVHLLLTPGRDATAISRLMKELARRATRRWNIQRAGSGSLWEARFKSSIVQTEKYLLACCRYIELNPVRAGMVAHAGEYPWSSYRGRMGLWPDKVLDLHPIYLGLGSSEILRRTAYRNYLDSEVSEADLLTIRAGSRTSVPTSDERFVRELEDLLGRKVAPGARGRPLKVV